MVRVNTIEKAVAQDSTALRGFEAKGYAAFISSTWRMLR